jgi:S-adenosylmethionine hydrolase
MNTNQPPLIVLLTDFGNDPYSGIMIGRILQINPHAKIVILSNHIQSHNIKHGSFILSKSYRYFPPNTIFLVVVDPGVGSNRKALAIKSGNYYFIGPDNGVLTPSLTNDNKKTVVCLPTPKNVSTTFHGRDIFAPAAAKLSRNDSLLTLGPICEIQVHIEFFLDIPTFTGEVIFIDSFGNIITNLPYSDNLKSNKDYIIKTDRIKHIAKFRNSYYEGSDINPFLVVNSFNTIEIAIQRSRASDFLDIKPNDRIQIEEL